MCMLNSRICMEMIYRLCDIFYYNKDDSNFLVPKAYGIGRTFNFANQISWFFILVIIGLIVFRKFY
jgi:uncharacterized membrane protein